MSTAIIRRQEIHSQKGKLRRKRMIAIIAMLAMLLTFLLSSTLSYAEEPDDGSTPPEVIRYTVTYQYTGDVPEGAPALPAAQTYTEGESVTVADAPSMAGYTFSGWLAEEHGAKQGDEL